MVLSLAFAVLLLTVVAVYYLVPRRARCPGCGTVRDGGPLCSGCGWIFELPDDESPQEALAYGDDDEEPEVIDPVWER